MSTFSRYVLSQGVTWNYHVFRQHHTELNNYYWSYVAAARFAEREVGKSSSSPAVVLGAIDPTKNTLDDRIAWSAAFRNQQNWTRLSALMALSSYLELFLRKSVILALESDPGVQHGKSRAVDGFTFRKHSPNYSFASVATGCVKGDWNARISAYRKLFGHAPAEFVTHLSELEAMRRLRNSVGHAFGRGLEDYDAHHLRQPKAAERLAEPRLLKWLGIARDIALAVDSHLGPAHIGEYEMLCFYDQWAKSAKEIGRARARTFKKTINATLGQQISLEFAEELIAYYRTL